MYPDQHNYLIHWLKKGQKAKYIDKVKLANGRWRYFYTQAEVDAYKKGLSKSASSLADKARQGLHNLKEGAASAGARAVVNVTSRNERLRSMLGGRHQEMARGWTQRANQFQADANASNASAHKFRAYAASDARKGNDGAAQAMRYSADSRAETAKVQSSNASFNRAKAAEEQKAYDRSIVGRAENRVRADERRKSSTQQSSSASAKKTTRKSSDVGKSIREGLGRAREAVADRAAEAVVGAASRSDRVRNVIGGQHQDKARSYAKTATDSQNEANRARRVAEVDRASAASAARKGNESKARAARGFADRSAAVANEIGEGASILRSAAAREQKAYENSLLGRAQARVNRKKSRR